MQHISKLRNKRPNGGSSIERSSLIFLDIETTGLYPNRGARVTEIAILNRNKSLLKWHQGNDGNINESLENKFPTVYEHLAIGVVVGHNIGFDLEFLAYEAGRLGLRGPDVLFIDTLRLAQKICDQVQDFELETLLRKFDISIDEPMHTAIVDAQAARALFWKLVNAGEIETLGDANMQRLNWTIS